MVGVCTSVGNPVQVGQVAVLLGRGQAGGRCRSVDNPEHDGAVTGVSTHKGIGTTGQLYLQRVGIAGLDTGRMREHVVHDGYVVLGRSFGAECQRKLNHARPGIGFGHHQIVRHVIGILKDNPDAGIGANDKSFLAELQATHGRYPQGGVALRPCRHRQQGGGQQQARQKPGHPDGGVTPARLGRVAMNDVTKVGSLSGRGMHTYKSTEGNSPKYAGSINSGKSASDRLLIHLIEPRKHQTTAFNSASTAAPGSSVPAFS